MKVMIVDDSLTYRLILKEVLRSLPGVDVVASASNGEDALKKLDELNGDIDLTLLDLQMPVMDGMQTMAAIHERFPSINVVVVSGFNVENAELTIHALERGAVDFIRKPDHSQAEENVEELQKQLEHIIASCRKKNPSAVIPSTPAQQPTKSASAVLLSQNPSAPVSKASATAASVSAPNTPPPKTLSKDIKKQASGARKAIDVVTIGISTGGPAALLNVIPRLPSDLGVPILIVQHMPPLFTRSLADSLNAKSAVSVHEAAAGEVVQPNTVYIAPGGWHMLACRKAGAVQIALSDAEPEHSCRPAVDVLFRSVADVYGGNSLCIIMTGMGNDGATGMQRLKQTGAYCLTQTAESCVIYGMPRAADEMGLPDEHVSLDNLPDRIAQLVYAGRKERV